MHGTAQLRSGPIDWWLRWPALYHAELRAFERRGAAVAVIHDKAGQLILDIHWREGVEARLRVGYSPCHPFARANVSAPELTLARHQDPSSRTLCLLTQDAGQWDPCERVADLIAAQLPNVLKAAQAHAAARPTEAAAVEENAPDPLSTYFMRQTEPDSIIVFDAGQPVPGTMAGIAGFNVRGRAFGPNRFEGLLRSMEPLTGQWLAPRFTPWAGIDREPLVQGRWVRMKPRPTDTPAEMLAAADRIIERVIAAQPQARARMARLAQGDMALTVIVFDEEIEYGRAGVGFLFLVNRRIGKGRETGLVTGARFAHDVLGRVPVAKALRAKTALLVGAGAIGGFVAQDLVRAGLGRLAIVDPDSVEPGNGVRWALAREFWGLPKSHALYHHLTRNYPATEVVPHVAKIGVAVSDPAAAAEAKQHQMEWVRARVEESDVVIDASASTECQRSLASVCRDMGKPFIMGYATEGAAGGVVARFAPSGGGCPACLDEHWHDKTLPRPPVDSSGTITPVGCNTPTFTGGAFELQEVSLELVRSAIGTLAPNDYDVGDWPLAVLSLKDGPRRILPRWETAAAIGCHDRCWSCGGA